MTAGSRLIAALEQDFGPIQEGWTVPVEGHSHTLQIVRLEAWDGHITYATLGLSQFPLSSPSGQRRLHLELLMRFRREQPGDWPRTPICNLALEMIGRDLAVVRGDCIGPRGPLRPGSKFEALYCTSPVFLEDARHMLIDEAGRGIALVWVVPVTAEEARLRRDRGWDALEDRLDAEFGTLFDRG